MTSHAVAIWVRSSGSITGVGLVLLWCGVSRIFICKNVRPPECLVCLYLGDSIHDKFLALATSFNPISSDDAVDSFLIAA